MHEAPPSHCAPLPSTSPSMSAAAKNHLLPHIILLCACRSSACLSGTTDRHHAPPAGAAACRGHGLLPDSTAGPACPANHHQPPNDSTMLLTLHLLHYTRVASQPCVPHACMHRPALHPSAHLLLYLPVHVAQVLHVAHACRALVLHQQVHKQPVVWVPLLGQAQPHERAALQTNRVEQLE